MYVIGLMSGTSLDGIDAALVEFDGDAPEWSVRAFLEQPYSAEQRTLIHGALLDGTAASLCTLHAQLGEWFAAAALRACAQAGVAPQDVHVIGSHGQTVWHEPPRAGLRGSTLQLGCAATIAERTGIDVVHDFRARDMAAGGQGAPLVPFADRLLFAHAEKRRVLQNIGGMANLTWLPRRGEDAPLLAFDTGPGNALMDAAVELATRGVRTYDAQGEMAAAGTVDDAMLRELLAEPYYEAAPPKSTGRERFGRALVEALVARREPKSDAQWRDVVATLTELTARTVADAITRWVVGRGVDEVIVTGGGARNPVLVERIGQLLAPVPVIAGDALGIDPGAKEAVAFAALAWAHMHGRSGNVPEATGAAGARVLGSFTPGAKVRPVHTNSHG